MKKIFTILLAIVGVLSYAQTIYSENMGTPSGTTSFAANVWQNGSSSGITYSGSGDVRATSTSSGYTGASGGGNVFLTNTAGKNFVISGINTSAYASTGLTLSFGYLTNSTATQLTLEQSTDGGTTWTPITFTSNATANSWKLVSIGGEVASATNLSLRFTQPATAQMRIDDVKIVYVSATCALTPGSPTTACDASTLNLDNYTITIPFTGGGTATYTITPTSGTVGGDNPSTTASGNIVITGTVEGTGNTVTITGGTCNYSIAVAAPANGCKPVNTLPVNEPFNYTTGDPLVAQQMWKSANSGDHIVVSAGSLTYPGVASSGNSISFDGAGIDAIIPFTNTTTGAIYSSFMFSVTDLSNITTDLASSYFAVLTDQTGNVTTARLYVRRNGTQYQFGLGSGTTPDTWSPNLYDVNTVQYLTFGYDFAANKVVLFENQVTPTVQSIMVTPTAAIPAVGGLEFRQDAAATTPFIKIDELKIDNTVITLGVSDIININSRFVKNTLVSDEISFGTKADVKIYSMNGQVVKAASVNEYRPMNVSDLTPGMYIVTGMVDGQPVSQKILKK